MASNPLVEAVQHFSLSQLVADPNLCRNVLNDVGAQPAEVFVLVAALEARIPQTLMEHIATNDLSVVEPRLVAELNQRGVELSRAEWAVNAWKEVVGGSTSGQPTVRPTQAVVQPPVEAATVRPTQPIINPPPEAATIRPTQPVVAPQPVAAAPVSRPPVQHPSGPPPRDDGGRKRTFIIAASIVVLLVAGIAVWLATRSSGKHGTAGPTSSGASSSAGPSTPASSGATSGSSSQTSASTSASVSDSSSISAALGAPKNFKVAATVAWTSTGLEVTKGQRINITATGQMSPGNGTFCGPNGLPGAAFDIYSIIGGGEHHAALIGLIAATDELFIVGANYNGVAPASGRLYLGINDVGVANNTGQYTATVRLQQT